MIQHEGSRETLSKLLPISGHPAANGASQVSVTVQITLQTQQRRSGDGWKFEFLFHKRLPRCCALKKENALPSVMDFR